MESLCVVVPRSEGEFTRKKLSELGILRKDLRIHGDRDILFIPITDGSNIDMVLGRTFFEETKSNQAYQEIVDVPAKLKPLLPTSFDVVGDICVIKLGDELRPYAGNIGDAILESNKNIETVMLDKGVVGELRTRDVGIIAGRNRTNTIHKEYGMKFELDISKMYFSPRLASERKRIADSVRPGEVVIDMFSGIGPFSLLIEKLAEPAQIYAIDLNPEATAYLDKNIVRNKLTKIKTICGDARLEIGKLPEADRIIMNLPHNSLDFLDAALAKLKAGGTIHLYLIVGNDEIPELAGNARIAAQREVHTYSPGQSLFVFDIVKESLELLPNF